MTVKGAGGWYVYDPGYTGTLVFETGAVANWTGYSNTVLAGLSAGNLAAVVSTLGHLAASAIALAAAPAPEHPLVTHGRTGRPVLTMGTMTCRCLLSGSGTVLVEVVLAWPMVKSVKSVVAYLFPNAAARGHPSPPAIHPPTPWVAKRARARRVEINARPRTSRIARPLEWRGSRPRGCHPVGSRGHVV